MLWILVEVEGMRRTRKFLLLLPTLQLDMLSCVPSNIRISENNHVFIVTVLEMRILRMFGLHVVRPQLDMVGVVCHCKGSFKQRVDSIPPNGNPRPPDITPTPISLLYPCITPKDPMLITIDRLRSNKIAILIQISDGSAFGNNTMTRLESQLYPLLLSMQVQNDVEMGVGMYTVRGCLYYGIFDKGEVSEGLSTLRMRCELRRQQGRYGGGYPESRTHHLLYQTVKPLC